MPAWLPTSRRTSNEPLGAFVVRVPLAAVEPSWTSRQRQVWPTWLLSTSPSTSSRPSSGPTLTFQSVAPEQEPRRTTSSPPLAWAAGAVTAAIAAVASDGGGDAAVAAVGGAVGAVHGSSWSGGRLQRAGGDGQPTIGRWYYDPCSTTGSPSRTVPGVSTVAYTPKWTPPPLPARR